MKIGKNLRRDESPLYGIDELGEFLGYVTGSWWHQLFVLYAVAQTYDQRRLGQSYPALVTIYETWRRDYAGTDAAPLMPPTPAQLDAALSDIYGIGWRDILAGADERARFVAGIPHQPVDDPTDPRCRCGHPMSLHVDDLGPCTGEPGAPANTWCDCTGYVGNPTRLRRPTP